MRKAEYQRRMMRRIARTEAESHGRILRAFRDVLRVLEHERTEYQVFLARLNARRGPALPPEAR